MDKEELTPESHGEKSSSGDKDVSLNVRHTLERCTNVSDYFREVHTHVNKTLTHDPRIRQALTAFEEKHENILDAVVRNDFSGLECSPTSEEYPLVLQLTATKNRMIASIIEENKDILIDKLGLTVAEWKTIQCTLSMTPAADQIYMSWRESLYPPRLRKQLAKSKDAAEFLEKNDLDDPYAIVREDHGKWVNVPYALAFPKAVAMQTKYIDNLMKSLSKEEHLSEDTQSIIAYLKAYSDALNCDTSTKVNGEWISVALWKDVDKAWLACKGRVQIIHGIENEYEPTIDPSGIKVIPELKVLIRNEITSDIDRMVQKMQQENSAALKKLLADHRDVFDPRQYRGSSVGMYTSVIGGGNSMDNMALAQVGPNDEQVWKMHGIKSYIDPEEIKKLQPLANGISKHVFGEEHFTQQFEVGTEGSADRTDRCNVEYIGGHELGHTLLNDMDTGDMEEAKATWSGMVPLWERYQKGSVSRETLEDVLREHIKSCLYYLSEQEDDPYRREATINAKLFLDSGLLRYEDGKWMYDSTKVDSTYDHISSHWRRFVESYLTQRDTGDASKKKQHNRRLQEWTTPDHRVKALIKKVRKGRAAYNASLKKDE